MSFSDTTPSFLPLAKDRSPQAIDGCACYEMSNLMSGTARSALGCAGEAETEVPPFLPAGFFR